MKIIDCRVHFHTKSSVAKLHDEVPPHDARYAEIYTHASEDFWRDSPALKGKTFVEALKNLVSGPTDMFVRLLDDVGISKALLTGRDTETATGSRMPNDELAVYIRNHPDRIIALAGVDPFKGMAAVRELERCVKELGFRGVSLSPWVWNVLPTDKHFYPVYAKCVELDAVCMIHCGMNFGVGRHLEVDNPTYIDEIACDFPELKIIANHAGWPWVTELVAVAWRHPNVYICPSAVRAKYLGMANTGWGPLLHYGNSVIQDKILYGTSWPSLPFKRNIEETMELPLKDSVKEKWFYKNAERLFGITA